MTATATRDLRPRNSRSNAFDLLRLLAALAVLVEHSWLLSGNGLPLLPGSSGTTFGQIGLGIFFLTSGYLVLDSWLADPSAPRFAARRALRIYPLWALVIVGLALVAGPLLTSLPLGAYYRDEQTWSFLVGGLLVFGLEFELPGVFTDNVLTSAVNGALWTIPIEILCYLGLLLLGVLGALRHRLLVVALALVPLTVLAVVDLTGYTGTLVPRLLDHRAAELLAFFALGMVVRVVAKDQPPAWPLAPVAVGVWLLSWGTPATGIASVLAVTAVTLTIAFRAPPALHHPTGRFDLSYGVYVLSYPTQQALVHAGVENPALVLLLTVLIVLPAAALTWRFVERPALRRKPRRPSHARRPARR